MGEQDIFPRAFEKWSKKETEILYGGSNENKGKKEEIPAA